jgi:V/A-type H+-transporting ATPase subunit D
VVAERFEELMELVLEAAAREVLIRRLGEALAKTSRQVNMLEQRIGPGLNSQITSVQRVLDEREREEHGRLRRLVKSRGKMARSTARTR